MSTDARSAILGRVRDALRDVPLSEPPAWEGAPLAGVFAGDLVEVFAERVADYRATVTRCDDDAVADAVAAILERHAAQRIVVPTDLPAAWTPSTGELLPDAPPLTVQTLDDADGVLTAAALGIAETGTIVLDGTAGCGRRALTLVPDLHVCVVRETQVVATVPDAIAALTPAVAAGRPITLISGPSATSDIELDRVEGVHGPRRLEVVLVR